VPPEDGRLTRETCRGSRHNKVIVKVKVNQVGYVIVIHNDTRSTECYVIVIHNDTRPTKCQIQGYLYSATVKSVQKILANICNTNCFQIPEFVN
jgi:hypothetical protein